MPRVTTDAIRVAIDNARAAGVGHLIDFEVGDIRDFRPPVGPPGTLLCNPPYGERIGEELLVRYLALLYGRFPFRGGLGLVVGIITELDDLVMLIDKGVDVLEG